MSNIVDIVQNYWNHLEMYILQSYQLIKSSRIITNNLEQG